MKKNIICSFALLVFIFSCCHFLPFKASEQNKSLDVIFTHDTHSHILPIRKLDQQGQAIESGGYARLASAINNLKKSSQNNIVLDAGDITSGSLFQTLFTTQAPELRLLGEMGVDATTLGNHEFDFYVQGLADMLNSAVKSQDKLPKYVVSNLQINPDSNGNYTQEQTNLKSALENYGAKDYEIFQKGDVKIAVFGLLGKDARKNIVVDGVSFEDNIEAAKNTVNKIKQEANPDIIICLSHSGTSKNPKKSEDELLAKAVPDIDLIVSGHSHTVLEQPIVCENTYIVSCGSYCEKLGDIKLEQNSSGKWKLKNYSLVDIDSSLNEDPNIISRINYFKSEVEKNCLGEYGYSFDQVLAYSPFNFSPVKELGQSGKENALGNLISDSYRYALKSIGQHTDIALVPYGTIRSSIVKGNLTTSDAFNICPCGVGFDNTQCYPLVTVYVKGKDLKSTCEIDASVSNLMPEASIFMSGISYTYNPNRMFMDKVTDVKIIKDDNSREPVDDNKLYSITTGLYSAQMLGTVKEKSYNLLNIPIYDKDGNEITDFKNQVVYKNNNEYKEWQAIADYLQSFEKTNNVSQIPENYSEIHHDLKIQDNSKNIFNLIKNPGKTTLIAIIFIVVFVLIIVILLFFAIKLIKKIKRKHNKLT